MYEVNKDLDTVTCLVETSVAQFPHYVDRSYIEPKLTKEATKSLKSNGINVIAAKGIPKGRGGAAEFIIEILKTLFQAKEYVELGVFLVKIPFLFFGKVLSSASMRTRGPHIKVNLYISSDRFATNKNFYDDIAPRLINLYALAYREANRLSREYPLYTFSPTIGIFLTENSYRALYQDDINTELSYLRMMRVIDKASPEDGLNLYVRTVKYGLIRHQTHRATHILNSPHREYDWRYIKKPKVYFTILSAKVMNNVFHKRKTMNYEMYSKKYLGNT